MEICITNKHTIEYSGGAIFIKSKTIITSHRMTQTSRLQASMHSIVISTFSYSILELISSKKFLNSSEQKCHVGFLLSSDPLALDLMFTPTISCFELSSKSLLFHQEFLNLLWHIIYISFKDFYFFCISFSLFIILENRYPPEFAMGH